MRAEIIKTGELVLYPEAGTETFAYDHWVKAGGKVQGVGRQSPAIANAPIKTTMEKPTPVKRVDGAESERDQIKAKLTALGLEFAPQTRTPTLKQMLANATGASDTPEEKAAIADLKKQNGNGKAAQPADDPAADDLFNPGTPSYTIAQVREALMAFAGKHGNPKTKALLTKYGAKNISGLDAKNYTAIMADASKG